MPRHQVHSQTCVAALCESVAPGACVCGRVWVCVCDGVRVLVCVCDCVCDGVRVGVYGCACGCVGVLVIVMAFTSHNGGVMCCFMCNNFDTRAGATRLAATLATFDNKDHCDHIADARLLNTEGGRQELAKVATKRVATYSPDSGDTGVRVCTRYVWRRARCGARLDGVEGQLTSATMFRLSVAPAHGNS